MSPHVPSEIRDLAVKLLAHEASVKNLPGPNMQVAIDALEALRRSLITLAGVDGFRALLTRALNLAKVQAPSLGELRIRPDGSLEPAPGMNNGDGAEAGLLLLTRLLGLLAGFIGEGLMLHLVHDVFPQLKVKSPPSSGEDKHEPTS